MFDIMTKGRDTVLKWQEADPTDPQTWPKRSSPMNCWHCETELIWGGDHDVDDDCDDYSIVTNLSCPGCGSSVLVYLPKEQEAA
jgi:DNA-directed RNA polymerase subunit RPC12/RpoP